MSTPVHIVAGFLGAGKTTAIRAWMTAHAGRERAAVLVNDFGEAGMDAAFLGDAAFPGRVSITNIPGGCVCCTAPAGLARAVATVLDEVRPDRLFIEPSGLARPQDLIDLLSRGELRGRVSLHPTIVLVDPSLLEDVNPLLANQLEAADIVVANRCDLASPAALEAFRARAAALWPGPLRVLETTYGVLPEDALMWPTSRSPALRLSRPAPSIPSTDGYHARSFALGPDVRFGVDALRRLLLATPGIVRFKALLCGDDGWFRLDYAGGRLHLDGTAWRRDNRADVIVDASGDLDAFARDFDACRLPAEASALGDALALVGLDGSTLNFTREQLAGLPGQIPDVAVVVPGRSGAGVRLREVFDAAGVPADARFVLSALDGMNTPPAAVAQLGDAVLVHTLAGGPLPAAQGGPFRVLAPPDAGRSSCANVKQLVRLRVLP